MGDRNTRIPTHKNKTPAQGLPAGARWQRPLVACRRPARPRPGPRTPAFLRGRGAAQPGAAGPPTFRNARGRRCAPGQIPAFPSRPRSCVLFSFSVVFFFSFFFFFLFCLFPFVISPPFSPFSLFPVFFFPFLPRFSFSPFSFSPFSFSFLFPFSSFFPLPPFFLPPPFFPSFPFFFFPSLFLTLSPSDACLPLAHFSP